MGDAFSLSCCGSNRENEEIGLEVDMESQNALYYTNHNDTYSSSSNESNPTTVDNICCMQWRSIINDDDDDEQKVERVSSTEPLYNKKRSYQSSPVTIEEEE